MPSAWSSPRSQGFGPTDEVLDGPYQGYAHFNKGIDFAAPAGSEVPSNIEGTVVAAGNLGDGWGYSVKIRDAQGNIHNYGHLDPNIQVRPGQTVTKGQLIGLVGGEAAAGESSTGPHLSYDVKDAKGNFFDPEQFVSGTTNARANVGSAIKPTSTPQQVSGDPKNPSLGVLLKLQGQPITKSARTIKSGSVFPQATGDYETDAGAYFQAAQDAYDRLNNYISNSSDILQVDESSGIVAKWNSDTDAFDLVDEGATKILQEALAAQGSLDRLYNAQKAGLIKTGADSASAYLASEKEKAAAASNSYDDYVKRISDLAAVEDIPNQRAANLASTISTITKNAQSTGRTYSMGMGSSGRPQGTDFGQFATSMRSAIPSAAPKPYSINPAALEPPPQSSMKFPARQPDEILSEYYGGGTPQITPGDITIGGASGGFSQIPNAGLQPVAPIPVPNVNPLTSGQITPQTIASGMLGSSRWQNRVR